MDGAAGGGVSRMWEAWSAAPAEFPVELQKKLGPLQVMVLLDMLPHVDHVVLP
jgi:hypothetical protein